MTDRDQTAVKRLLTFNPKQDAGNEEKVNEFVDSFRKLLMSKDPAAVSAVEAMFSSFNKHNQKTHDVGDEEQPSEEKTGEDAEQKTESSIVHNSVLVEKINDWLYV